MVERSRIKLLTGALATVLLPGLAGCVVAPYRGPGPGPRGYPPHYYDYYYYPYASVYFHLYTGYYYYHDHGSWRRVRRLPPHIRLDSRRRRPLKIRDKDPWQRHDEHRRKYYKPSKPGRRAAPEPDRRDRRKPAPDTRRSAPPTRREQRPPPQQDRRERDQDRAEREQNSRRYEEYRKRPWGRKKN